MKRKQWEVPKIEFQEFSPNAFCSGCTNPTNMVRYDFSCNAGKGVTHYTYVGGYWNLTKNVYDVYTSDGTRLTSVKNLTAGDYNLFGACGKTHSVVVPKETDPATIFLPGHIDDAFTQQDENIFVFIWRGEDGNEIHATTSLGSGTDIPKNVS